MVIFISPLIIPEINHENSYPSGFLFFHKGDILCGNPRFISVKLSYLKNQKRAMSRENRERS
jgi:hypothetical protein